MSSRSTLSTEQVSLQLVMLQGETLSRQTKKEKNNNKKNHILEENNIIDNLSFYIAL